MCYSKAQGLFAPPDIATGLWLADAGAALAVAAAVAGIISYHAVIL